MAKKKTQPVEEIAIPDPEEQVPTHREVNGKRTRIPEGELGNSDLANCNEIQRASTEAQKAVVRRLEKASAKAVVNEAKTIAAEHKEATKLASK